MLTSKRLAENDAKTYKMTWKRQIRHSDVKHKSSYTPHVRRHFLAPVGFTEIPVGYARKMTFLSQPVIAVTSVLKFCATMFLTSLIIQYKDFSTLSIVFQWRLWGHDFLLILH